MDRLKRALWGQIEVRHSELIYLLQEFYSLLMALEAISPQSYLVYHVTPRDDLNVDAALWAGYSAEAIAVMYKLPYLEIDMPVHPHTFLITYLGADLDEEWFSDQRKLSNGEEIAPTAIRLTRSEIGGIEYVYDTDTSELPPNMFDTHIVIPSSDVCGSERFTLLTNDPAAGYPKVTRVEPLACLKTLMGHWRELRYLATPSHVDFSPPIYANSGGTPPQELNELERRRWQAKYNVWEATQKLKDMYLEHGWDIHARDQINFRCDEFVDEYDDYTRDVILPLLLQVEPSERAGWCFLTEEDELVEAEWHRSSTQ
ncbi:hypothetical protein F4679DRAFT_588047 [Xylaria curta]|nr:hypothetical protein F4679DRAFT_588047 [Xylaria curta]